jgi:hypothetical protein
MILAINKKKKKEKKKCGVVSYCLSLYKHILRIREDANGNKLQFSFCKRFIIEITTNLKDTRGKGRGREANALRK